MRLGIKGKQVLGVTSIVGSVVVALSLMHLSRLAAVSLNETYGRAQLLANGIFHRAREVVTGGDPYQSLRGDSGLRTMIEASLYSENVTYATITDAKGFVVIHSDRSFEGQPFVAGDSIENLAHRSSFSQLTAIFSGQGKALEYRQPLLLGDTEFGTIRIGVSTLLIRDELRQALRPAIATTLAALAVSVFGAMLLAQLLLRPIHVIRSGLTRLGRGELGVRLDLDQTDEFGELGNFFNTVSAQLSADRSQMAGQVANLESAVEHLEDAVAIVNARGQLLFANPAMRTLMPDAAPGAAIDQLLPPDHAMRAVVQQTLVNRQSRGPVSASFGDLGDRLVMAHAINDPKGDLVGVMLVARNLEYLSQVQSTIRYSRKLAALGRLSAGVAHEVKNPLNAMMIHLELLRQKIGARPPTAARALTGVAVADTDDAAQHVDIIATEIKRLDEVMQGFLKFSRPEDLKLQPVQLSMLFEEVVPIVRPEAERAGVSLVVECGDVPDVNGDPAMLRQAFLNLALNAVQAMPNGGTLRIACSEARDRCVAIRISDTGVGIRPEHLEKIFNLYFTTKERGSGIGLSMVYRTVQMHDGEIEVQSTPGAGTTFTVLLPQT
ncbi:MAG TPA: ATP-binding protein [Vicinamibacterales bacterium]|nr:ATP-binding protein [Vicinamibacterales bacterium]